MIGFFRRHLRGEYGLARAYWLHTVALTISFTIVGTAAVSTLNEEDWMSVQASAVASLLLVICSIGLWLFMARGAWASSRAHVGRGGKGGWAAAARVTLILWLLYQAWGLYMMRSDLQDVARLATGHEPFEREQWTIVPLVSASPDDGPPPAHEGPGTQRLALQMTGSITEGAAWRLRKLLVRNPAIVEIRLDSSGGWVHEAQKLANEIGLRALDTRVVEHCASSCTLVLMAGRNRRADNGARIGFHSASAALSGMHAQAHEQARLDLLERYRSMGRSEPFLERVAEVPHEGMWYPDLSELFIEGVLTEAPGDILMSAQAIASQAQRIFMALAAVTEDDKQRAQSAEGFVVGGADDPESFAWAVRAAPELAAAVPADVLEGASQASARWAAQRGEALQEIARSVAGLQESALSAVGPAHMGLGHLVAAAQLRAWRAEPALLIQFHQQRVELLHQVAVRAPQVCPLLIAVEDDAVYHAAVLANAPAQRASEHIALGALLLGHRSGGDDPKTGKALEEDTQELLDLKAQVVQYAYTRMSPDQRRILNDPVHRSRRSALQACQALIALQEAMLDVPGHQRPVVLRALYYVP